MLAALIGSEYALGVAVLLALVGIDFAQRRTAARVGTRVATLQLRDELLMDNSNDH